MFMDMIFTFITTDKNFAKRADRLAKEIKNGAKENKINSWFELSF